MSYVSAAFNPKREQLASWTVEWQDMHAAGKCPRCEDEMQFDWDVDYAEMSTMGAERSVTRKVTCACEGNTPHPNTPNGKVGCGAFWVVQFYEDASGGHAVPQKDPRLASAARALDAAGQDAEARLRAAAEKWVAGVAAVLALFGIAGTVTGGKLLESLSEGAREVVVWLTVGAVAVAVVAIVFSYLAAYGWPKVVEMTDAKLLEWYEGRRNRLRTIARRLRWGVVAAVASVALLMSAAALAWLNPSSSPQTVLKVTARDDVVTCGTLLTAKNAGAVRLRVADGTVKEVPLDTASKVESVKSC